MQTKFNNDKGSTIVTKDNHIPIHIKTMDDSFTICVCPITTTIQDLKDIVKKRTGIKRAKQRCMYRNQSK